MLSRRNFLSSVPAIAAPALLPEFFEAKSPRCFETSAEVGLYWVCDGTSFIDAVQATLFADLERKVFGARKKFDTVTMTWELDLDKVLGLWNLSGCFTSVTNVEAGLVMRERKNLFSSFRHMGDFAEERRTKVALQMDRRNFDIIILEDKPVTSLVRIPFKKVDEILCKGIETVY